MTESEPAPPAPTVPTVLLRFTVQGALLGAAGAVLVGVVFAFPFFTLLGYIGVLGAVLGGPAGLVAGLGASLAARLSTRAIPVALGGAAGAALVMVPAALVLGGFSRGVAFVGGAALAVALIGAAIASPLTLRALGRREARADDRLGAWLLVLALVLESAAVLIALALAVRTFSVSEACRGFGGGDASESLFPPQITCFSGNEAVELIPRGWHALVAAASFAAVALTVVGLVRILRRGSADPVTLSGVGGSGAIILVIGVIMAAGLAQPPVAYVEPPAPAAPASPRPDPGPAEEIPLDPDAGLPEAPALSTSFTRESLVAALQQLADDSFAVAGPIDDPEIPAGVQTYPVQTEVCNEGGVRAVLDIWFATGANAAGLDRIEDYWTSLGYTVLSEPGHVAAAGREPLPAQRLDLLQTWDEDDLRLRLTSLCVADGAAG